MKCFDIQRIPISLDILFTIIICTERGCPGAALRVWPWVNTRKTPIELCGESVIGKMYNQILSDSNVMRLS